jgi:hypothetical protein
LRFGLRSFGAALRGSRPCGFEQGSVQKVADLATFFPILKLPSIVHPRPRLPVVEYSVGLMVKFARPNFSRERNPSIAQRITISLGYQLAVPIALPCSFPLFERKPPNSEMRQRDDAKSKRFVVMVTLPPRLRRRNHVARHPTCREIHRAITPTFFIP